MVSASWLRNIRPMAGFGWCVPGKHPQYSCALHDGPRVAVQDLVSAASPDGATNSNQLCAGSSVLSERIVMNQNKNSAPNASPAATGIVCNNAAGDLPRNNNTSQ